MLVRQIGDALSVIQLNLLQVLPVLTACLH